MLGKMPLQIILRILLNAECVIKSCLFWWLVRAVPLDKGNVIKWFGTCTDIQNIKETGIELLKAKEHAEESDRLKSAFQHESRDTHNEWFLQIY
jgi:hypothetical protein